jgi:hypothetical protein
MTPDGTIAIVRASDYHVDWMPMNSPRTSSAKMPFDWRRITDDEKVRILDSLNAMQAQSRATQDSFRVARGGRGGSTSMTDYAPPKEMPDYYPPVRDGTIRVDPEGNLWILPSTSSSAQGGLLYDVVNRKGEIFERVQLPGGCSLNGLGAKGVVYLACGSRRLERRRVIRSNQ